MNHYVPHFDIDDSYANANNAAVPSFGHSSRQMNKQPDEIMELLWENGQVVVHSQNQQRLPRKSPPPPTTTTTSSQQHHHHQTLPTTTTTTTLHHQQQHNGDAAAATHQHHHLFIQEDEMASWLHYPLDYSPLDRELDTEFLFQPPAPAARTVEIRPNPPQPPRPNPPDRTAASRPPPTLPPPHPTPAAPAAAAPATTNFPLFSRMRATATTRVQDPGPSATAAASSKHKGSSSNNNNNNHLSRPPTERETTMVDSSETPMMAASRIPQQRMAGRNNNSTVEVSGSGWSSFGCRDTTTATTTSGGGGGRGEGGCPSVSREGETCEMTLTSSPGGSGASASATATTTDRGNPLLADDRKRKAREAAADANGDCHSEDVEIESAELRKQSRGSSGTKRSRAAEVHNLSERRRRDRINEKMKALQELIPRCSKTDKASMLDEAIEYLKSLQMQVQMMSMGCGMIPMMFPQQYMPPMGMGMGMGMGLEMGMNRPMMPFPAILAGSALQAPAGAAPRFQLPTFPMPPTHHGIPSAADISRMQQVVGQAEMGVGVTHHHPLGLPGQPSLPGIPNITPETYQQYMSIQHQMQAQNSQNQPHPQPGNSKPSKNRGADR